MHINPYQSIPFRPAQAPIQQEFQDKQRSMKTFQDMLVRPMETEKKIETVSSWIQAISQLRQQLELDMRPENLNAYKESVRDFLAYYTKHDITLKEHMTRDDRMYYKKIRLIHVADEKVDKLTERLLDSQMGRLEILKRTGEIQGLLVDLTV